MKNLTLNTILEVEESKEESPQKQFDFDSLSSPQDNFLNWAKKDNQRKRDSKDNKGKKQPKGFCY